MLTIDTVRIVCFQVNGPSGLRGYVSCRFSTVPVASSWTCKHLRSDCDASDANEKWQKRELGSVSYEVWVGPQPEPLDDPDCLKSFTSMRQPVTCNNHAIAFHILSFNKIYSFLLLVNTDTLIPKLIIGVDKNIDTLGWVHRSLHYISQGVDAPQCICKALQKCFTFPRTVIDLWRARPTDVEDEDARRLRIVWFGNRRLKIL